MLEPDPAVIAAADAAVEKINEGLRDFIAAIADEGEPEVPINALLLFESMGMGQTTGFFRQQYLAVESNGSRTQMLGMLKMLTEQVEHDILCAHGASEE